MIEITKRILIIDDKIDDLTSMEHILSNAGYKVISMHESRSAIDKIEDSYDLILTDVRMPDISGYDILRYTRSNYENNIKVIFVSILPSGEVNQSGIDGFIQKPFSVEELLGGVKRAIGS